jgi:ABC-type molybdate transport system permease subunit
MRFGARRLMPVRSAICMARIGSILMSFLRAIVLVPIALGPVVFGSIVFVPVVLRLRQGSRWCNQGDRRYCTT